MVSILVACGKNNVIGKDGRLPWKDYSNLKMFREKTIGHSIIYGRKTWNSLPVVYLQGRTNIVLSNKAEELGKEYEEYAQPGNGLFFAKTLKEALELAHFYDPNEIFVIGGQMVFECALSLEVVDRVYMAKIYEICDGDRFFPELNGGWFLDSIETYDGFDVVEYTREEFARKQREQQVQKVYG